MKIDKNTIRITHRNVEIKQIMSEGGVLWEATYNPISGLEESDIRHIKFGIERANIGIYKKYLTSIGNRIVVNCNYKEMEKIYTTHQIYGKFISSLSINTSFEGGGYCNLCFNALDGTIGAKIQENKNDGKTSIIKISDTKYEINLLKDIKYTFIEVVFYGEHEISKKHFLDLCKQCDIKVEIE